MTPSPQRWALQSLRQAFSGVAVGVAVVAGFGVGDVDHAVAAGGAVAAAPGCRAAALVARGIVAAGHDAVAAAGGLADVVDADAAGAGRAQGGAGGDAVVIDDDAGVELVDAHALGGDADRALPQSALTAQRTTKPAASSGTSRQLPSSAKAKARVVTRSGRSIDEAYVDLGVGLGRWTSAHAGVSPWRSLRRVVANAARGGGWEVDDGPRAA